jgi:hypothetical protein
MKGLEDGIPLRASTALLTHLQKSGKGGAASLFEDHSAIFLEFRLKKMPGRTHAAPVPMCVLAALFAAAPLLPLPHGRALPLPPSPPSFAAPSRTVC